MRYKSNSSLSREKGLKKIWSRTELIHFICFELPCLLLHCPIKWRAGPSPHAAHRQRKGHHWKLPVSDAGQRCLLSTLRRQSEDGDTAKNLGIEYIILYIISMTQNVNRFIYSPMFKYICRLYTNSLENETANAFFFFCFPSLVFWTWYSEQRRWRGWWDWGLAMQSRGYRDIRKCILRSEWLVLKWPNETQWLTNCCRLREKEERWKKEEEKKLHCTHAYTYCLNSLRYL